MLNTLIDPRIERALQGRGMQDKPTVFIIDDDPDARRSVAALVRSADLTAEVFSTAEEFLENVDLNRPGCAIIDLELPGMSGLGLQTRLTEQRSLLTTIFVSGYAEIQSAMSAMRGGAVMFLEKPCREGELIQNVEAAIRRNAEIRKVSSHRAHVQAILDQLTPRETSVMELIVQGLPNKTIAKRLEISIKTVEVHRRRVFAKTEAQSVAELVRLYFETKQ